jgi:hypothetical protein
MPAISPEALVAAAKDPDTLEALQETVVAWSAILAETMQRESEKQPDGKGPLAEIDYWRARSAMLCGLWEQLHAKAASNVISAMEASIDDNNLMSAFKSQLAELGKLAHEVGVAKEVVTATCPCFMDWLSRCITCVVHRCCQPAWAPGTYACMHGSLIR